MSSSAESALALQSLSSSQLSFLHSLPKAELHAHLNGSIPLSALKHLASTYKPGPGDNNIDDAIQATLTSLSVGVNLDQITDFFSLFPAIYALTSTASALSY